MSVKKQEYIDCTWRRVTCGKKDCPICSKLSNELDDSGDDITLALQDITDNLKKVLNEIQRDVKKKSVKAGAGKSVKPPNPMEFILYDKIKRWRDDVYELAQNNMDEDQSWIEGEADLDMLWYTDILLTKTYKQLCNRWYLENKMKYELEDYRYTRYVLKETLLILKKTVGALMFLDDTQRGKLNIAAVYLDVFKEEIMSI